ncbi:MAG: hypothetical protein AAF990_05760, partial [Bacteroidota bacterium]
MMPIYKRLLAWVIVSSCLCLTLQGQVLIEYVNPTTPNILQVCDSAAFEIKLTNTGPDSIRTIEVVLGLPNGLTYNPSSVQNATERDISNLQMPTFGLPNLGPGDVLQFSLQATAQCDLVDQINNAVLFANDILVNYEGGSNSLRTSNYDIETPLLVVVGSTGLALMGSKGMVLQRTFTIRNTRFGRLSSFVFKDTHPEDLSITANPGMDTSSTNGEIALLLDGDDFRNIGDGDAFFEQNETIVIREEILVDGCGIEDNFLASSIRLCWGCNGEICQTTTPIEAIVEVEPSQLTPDLVFRPVIQAPSCFCPAGLAQQEMHIYNRGNETALDIILTLYQTTFIGGYTADAFTLDSSGTVSSLTPILSDPLPLLCLGSNQIYREAILPIPDLAVGDSITIFWTDAQCADECGRFSSNKWEFDYAYYRSCPPDPLIQETGIELEIESPFTNYMFPLQAPDSLTNLFSYTLVSDVLTTADEGSLQIVLDIPCFASWENNAFELNGQAPTDQVAEETDSTTLVTLTYDLPLSSDSVSLPILLEFDCLQGCDSLFCDISTATTCQDVCSVSGLVIPGILAQSTINVDPDCSDECGAQVCSRGEIQYPCLLPPCKDTIPGYAVFDFELFRLNTGLPDNDNDHFPDASGQLDTSKIRRDRLMTGDTIRSIFNGAIKVDVEGSSFSNLEFQTRFLIAGNLDTFLNANLFSTNGWQPVEQFLRIYDQSDDRYYECGNFPLTFESNPQSKELIFRSTVNAGNSIGQLCGLPTNFVFEEGDSIYVELDYKVSHNIIKADSTQTLPDIYSIVGEPDIFLFDSGQVFYRRFSCDCHIPVLELSGYCYSLAPGIYPIPPCDPSAFTSGSFFQILLGEGDFFPFEFRHLAQLEELQLNIPEEFSLVEARLVYLQLQDQTSLILDQPLNPRFENGVWELGVTELIPEPLDEGYTLLMQFRFESECNLEGNFPLSLDGSIRFVPGIEVDTNPLPVRGINALGLRTLIPRMQLNVPLANSTSLDDRGRWEMTIVNNPTRIASTESGPLYNCWATINSTSGKVTDFQLFDRSTGSFYQSNNGIFQLGQLDPRDTFHLLLTAVNGSCVTEEVTLRYGWNCTAYDNLISEPCYERTELLTVISPPAELEQVVESPQGPFGLCDTIDYHVVEFFNADLGRAYEVLVEAQLPPGMMVLPGSSELEYPVGSNYVSIPEPIDLGGGQVRWDISVANDSIGQNGLPGSSLEPNNRARLRFQLITDCDFISNSEIIARVRANQNCDVPANTLAEAGEAIQIDGVMEPYNANISVTPIPTVSCRDQLSLSLSIVSTGTTSAADSLFLLLPPGLTYLPGSYQAIQNAPAQGPTTTAQGSLQQLRWRLPTGIAAGTPIRFSLEAEGLDSLDCGQQLIRIQTLSPANALCAADGQSCDILVETGSLLSSFRIDRPILEPAALNVRLEATGNAQALFYQLEVGNTGPDTEQITYVDFYVDLDGDGRLSIGDLLVGQDSITTSIPLGTAVALDGNLPLDDPSQLCQLIAVIDPDKHCACQTASVAVANPIEWIRPAVAGVCSGEGVLLGIDSATNTVYQWNPSDFLECAACPKTAFQFENTTDEPVNLTYTLSQQDTEGCIIDNIFSVTVQPEPRILTEENQLCLGAALELTATPGVTYFWQGPDILDPNLAVQTVRPMADALYTVMITDSSGCTKTDSIAIAVTPLPGVDAGQDTAICDNTVFRLEALQVDGYSYAWSPANLLSNPTAYNPTILQNVSTTFYLTITDENGCAGSDSV